MKTAPAWLIAAAGLVLNFGAAAQSADNIPLKPNLKLKTPINIAQPYTAQLVNRNFSGEVHIQGVNWSCKMGSCSTSATWPAPTVAACSQLAGKAGPLANFGTARNRLPADQLASCNQSASGNTPAATNQIAVNLKTAAVPNPQYARIQPQLLERKNLFTKLLQDRKAAEEAAKRAAIPRSRTPAKQGEDCDDTRRDVHPLAAEVCDGRDNNCDGVVDEGQMLTFFLDADGDGHGDPAQRIDACPADQQRAAREGRWLVAVGNDCNDADSTLWQGCP